MDHSSAHGNFGDNGEPSCAQRWGLSRWYVCWRWSARGAAHEAAGGSGPRCSPRCSRAAARTRPPSCARAPYRQSEITLAENYQSVYRRLADVARRCWTNSFLMGSNNVDADLCSELGLGHISSWHSSGLSDEW
jgi:hypothetical protein